MTPTPDSTERQQGGEVTREDALKFLGTACRNWQHISPLTKDDVQDVADALKWFLAARHKSSERLDASPFIRAIAEDRKRFNERSPTWNAYGFCIAICEDVACEQPAGEGARA